MCCFQIKEVKSICTVEITSCLIYFTFWRKSLACWEKQFRSQASSDMSRGSVINLIEYILLQFVLRPYASLSPSLQLYKSVWWNNNNQCWSTSNLNLKSVREQCDDHMDMGKDPGGCDPPSELWQCPCWDRYSAQPACSSRWGQGFPALSGSLRMVLLRLRIVALQASAQPDHSVHSLTTQDTAEGKETKHRELRKKTKPAS